MIANLLLAVLPVTRWFGCKRWLLRALGIDVAEGARICGYVRFHGAGRVAIGASAWVGPNTRFYTATGGDITIGARCDIAPDVVLITGTHDIGGPECRAGANIVAPIAIGAGSWIGVRATILPGASIGAGSIVAAGSLVRGETFGPDLLLMGLPARPTRTLEP